MHPSNPIYPRLLSVKDLETNQLHTRIRLFEVEAIHSEYTFQGFKKEKERDIHMESNKNKDCIEIYIPQGSSEENQPVLIAKELVKFFLTLPFEDACVALSMRFGALEAFLENKGVPDVDYEEPPESDLDESEVKEEFYDNGEDSEEPLASRQTTPDDITEIVPDIRVAAHAIVERNMAKILRMSFAEPPQPPLPPASQAFDAPSPVSTPRRRSRRIQRRTNPNPHTPGVSQAHPTQANPDGAPPATPLRTQRRAQESPSQDDRPNKRQRTNSDLDGAFGATLDQAEAEMFPLPDGEAQGENEAGLPENDSPEAREIATGILGELFVSPIDYDVLS